MDLLTDILNKKLLLISGKGGIGKSLVAAALGQAAAAQGRRVLIVESASQAQQPALFGRRIDDVQVETMVAPNLFIVNLDARRCFEEYVVKYLKLQKLYQRVFNNSVVKSFLNTIPGLAETMLLGRLFYTCMLAEPPESYDLVVFDGPASGHFLQLLGTPDAIMQTGLAGPLMYEVRRVKAFLADAEQCAAIYLATPERLVVAECLDFLPQLRASCPTPLAAVFINRVYRPNADQSFAALEKLQDDALAPARRYIQEDLENREAQQALLTKALGSTPAICLPERGAIAEPLPEDFWRDFLSAALRHKGPV